MADVKINCSGCGQDHVRDGKATCNAHSRRATPLRPCRLFPPLGLTVCRFHGGAAPQVVRAGVRRYIAEAIEGQVAEHFRANPTPSSQLLPEPRPKKGRHKNPNSRSARRARLRRESYRRDEAPEHGSGDGADGQ